MKSSTKLSLLSLALLSISPTVLAQYAGTVGDLNTVFDPPMNINGTLCDQHTNTGNEHAYKACSDGVSAARWMAEKYAKNTGKYLGCLDGFYQGVADGYHAGINPTAEMTREAQAYVRNANFNSASSRGLERARAEGQTESADQIISRYRSVVGVEYQGRQVLPNKEYNYPKVTFNGFEDGYEFDVLQTIPASEFQAVYATGWVNAQSSFDDRLAARRAYALQKEYANSLCNMNDTVFGRRNMPNVSLWDFFRARRQYNFQNYGWRNPDWAWEIFDRDERTLEQYQTFTRLKQLEKTVTETIPVKEQRYKLDASGNPIKKLDANGQPVVDAQGKPVFEMEEVITGYKTETKRVKLSDAEVKALMNIYTNGFKTAYDRFYARQYASINYHTEGLEKYKIAKILGQSIGQEVAQHTARKDAYNNQYRLQSAKKYAEEVKRLYKQSFDRLIYIFENNPVIELNDAEVIGQTNDGIFRPGEELKVAFAVTNLGEMAAPSYINFENSADVKAVNLAGYSFVAPVLNRSNFVTNTLGVVSNNREARQTVQLNMAIANPGDLAEVAKSLVVRKQRSIGLNDYTEINRVNGDLDFLQGRLALLIDVVNPSNSVASPISVVEASLNNIGMVEKNVEPIAPGATRQVAINVEGMDPLAIINAGSISGQVNARLAGKVAHRAAVSYSINVDRAVALVMYLDALATERTSQTGNESKTDRVARLQGLMEEMVMASIEENILWKKETDRTIIAVIQNVYNESKRARRISKEAQDIYDSLGKILAAHVNDRNFRAGGGVRLSAKGNKKDFLKEISKFAKISTRPNDY